MNNNPEDFKFEPFPGINTIWKAYNRTLGLKPNFDWLGTRTPDNQGNRPYQWKKWAEIDTIVQALRRGYVCLDLMEEIEGE